MGVAEDRLPKMWTKFAPRLRKSLRHRGFGPLFEVELLENCTTPARESDFCEKKHHAAWSDHFWKLSSAKFAPRLRAPSRDVFGGSKRFSRGRRKDFDTLQNTWQAQEFVRVAKTLASVVDLKNDAFRVAGAVISRFVMSMFEASDAESVERLQISCHGRVTWQASYRVAVTGVRLPWLNFFVAGAMLLKHLFKNR